MILLFFLFSLSLAWGLEHNISYRNPYWQPEQVHIAFGDKTNDIVVTWSTFNKTEESRVQYGVGMMNLDAVGTSSVFPDARNQWVHRVTLKDLKYDTKYVYHCGSKDAWSERFEFKTPPGGEDWVVRAAIYGDMGTVNAKSLPYLQDEAERNLFDMILHVGDFAYDMYEEQGLRGDEFMRQIEPLAAIVPYMTVPGNHEENHNFTQYKTRFTMPNLQDDSESMFYSFDIGPVHFICINTEAYYFMQYGLKPLASQYDWLLKDLAKANSPENRSARPWLIMLGHRPMYCSNSDDIDCSVEYTRKGLPFIGAYSLEPLLKEYGVDIVIWAHEHSYERTWPVYDTKVYNGSYEQPYVNPKAPVHIVTGSAGCREKVDPFFPNPKSWSAFRSSDYGFTRFRAHNNTHVYFEQMSVDKNAVIDSFWIVKDIHAPYSF